MMKLTEDWVRSGRQRGKRGETGFGAEKKLNSYVLQEAEGLSRAAKLWYCNLKGHRVHNLQHDGIVASTTRQVAPAELARALTRVTTRALGYDQPVEAK